MRARQTRRYGQRRGAPAIEASKSNRQFLHNDPSVASTSLALHRKNIPIASHSSPSLIGGDRRPAAGGDLGLVWFMPLTYPTKILVTWKAPSLVWFIANFLAVNRLFDVAFTKRCQLFGHPWAEDLAAK
jgi:hypothetical protein